MQQLKDYSIHITVGTFIAVLVFMATGIFYVSGVVNKVEANEINVNTVSAQIKDLQLDIRINTDLTQEINTKLEILLPNY